MKSTLKITILLFLLLTDSGLYSQITEKKAFLFSIRPNLINIDSSFENLKLKIKWMSFNKQNGNKEGLKSISFDHILTPIYLPFHYLSNCSSEFNDLRVDITNSNKAGNNYYTILNVIYADEFKELITKFDSTIHAKKVEIDDILTKMDFSSYGDFNSDSIIWKQNEKKIYVDWYKELSSTDFDDSKSKLFILRNDLNGDTLYCNDINHFILVPFFIKQKELYRHKRLIYDDEKTSWGAFVNIPRSELDSRFVVKSEDDNGEVEIKGKNVTIDLGSKWTCTDVTLIKTPENIEQYSTQPSHQIYYLLKNDKDQQIALTNIKGFIEEQNYLKREAEKKLQKEQLLTIKRQEEQVKKEIKKKNNERRHLESISLFGQLNGELIAQGKVKIGMTKEMCQYAWGKPLWLNKTTTKKGIFENWFYFMGYSLHFENNTLTRIEE